MSENRERKLLSIEDLRRTIKDVAAPKRPGQFVAMRVEKLAKRINAVVDMIDEELTSVATELDERRDSVWVMQHRLSDIRKQTAMIRHYLAPQRQALVEWRVGHAQAFDARSEATHDTKGS